jgi:hypothetical protein
MKKVNEELKKEGGIEIPPEVKRELEKVAKQVKQEYELDSVENTGNRKTYKFKLTKKSGRKTRRQKGGDATTNIYKKQTVLEQPNQVVYSCSKITAPPLLPVPAFSAMACHLGYMGVSYTGAVVNTASGVQGINTGIEELNGLPHAIPAMFRDYLKEAELYEENGKWTYFSDQQYGYSMKAQRPIV